MKNWLLLLACVLLAALPLAAQKKAVPAKKPSVDLAKKIADATPESLPQAPTDGRAQTDAQDENLKGKVRSIIEHTADNSYARPERKPNKEDYFNEAGNLVRVVEYDDGYPSSVTVYGYVDGMRVTRTGDVAYAEGEKPSSERLTITVRVEDNLKYPDLHKDTRYSIRRSYKYDPRGRLVEEQILANNGELVSRKTYTYEGNDRRVVRDSGADAGEWSRTLEILDRSGNIVERQMFDGDGKVSDIEVNKYEFDAKGNWIIQRSFEKTVVRSKPMLKPLWTSYRTITYYP